MKKIFELVILLPMMVSCSCARQGSEEGEKVLVLTHAAIINTPDVGHQYDLTVIITGGRITDIKKTGSSRSPKEAQVIDATGKFLIPGLWDMHVQRPAISHCTIS